MVTLDELKALIGDVLLKTLGQGRVIRLVVGEEGGGGVNDAVVHRELVVGAAESYETGYQQQGYAKR